MAAPIVIYSRVECHLCDEAKALVAPVAARRKLAVETIDVDSDPALAAKFGLEVPVVFVAGRKAFKFRVDLAKLESLLDRAARGDSLADVEVMTAPASPRRDA